MEPSRGSRGQGRGVGHSIAHDAARIHYSSSPLFTYMRMHNARYLARGVIIILKDGQRRAFRLHALFIGPGNMSNLLRRAHASCNAVAIFAHSEEIMPPNEPFTSVQRCRNRLCPRRVLGGGSAFPGARMASLYHGPDLICQWACGEYGVRLADVRQRVPSEFKHGTYEIKLNNETLGEDACITQRDAILHVCATA